MARLDDLRTAYAAQNSRLVEWLTALDAEHWQRPSRLPKWSVLALAFHATDMTAVVVRALAAGPVREPPQTIAAYTSAWPAAADEIAARDLDASRGLDASAVLANAASARSDLLAALDATSGDPVVAGRRGALRLSDLLVTRVNELVVHSLDLSASLAAVPDVPEVVMDRAALGVSCRMLTAILAERVPGHTVEVRVPPYSAIQCIDGPRHTRGTPANVVEANAVTWVEVATGRQQWSEAVRAGGVRASGERADLSSYLPVLS